MNDSTLEAPHINKGFPSLVGASLHDTQNNLLNETNKRLIEDGSIVIDDIESRQNISFSNDYTRQQHQVRNNDDTIIEFDKSKFKGFEDSLCQNEQSGRINYTETKDHQNNNSILGIDFSTVSQGDQQANLNIQENTNQVNQIQNEPLQQANETGGSQSRQSENTVPTLQRTNSNQSNLNELLILSRRVNNEVKALLLSHLEFYFFVIVTYLNLILIFKERITYFVELPVLFIFTFLQIRKLYKAPYRDGNLLIQRRKNRFLVIDWLSILFYFTGVSIKLKLSNTNPDFFMPITACCILPSLNLLIYSLLKKIPSATIQKRKYFMAKRIIFWCQMWLISLKLDFILKVNWSIVFSFALIVLGAFMIYSILPLIIFLVLIFIPFRATRIARGASDKTKIIGFGWSFLVSLFSVVWFVLILGLQRVINSHNGSNLFTIGIIIAIVHNVILILFTFLEWSQLKTFLNHLSLHELYSRAREREESFADIIKFEIIEPEIPYLVMISPTFHQLLHQEIKNYSREEIRSWRDQISQVKTGKYQKRKNGDTKLLDLGIKEGACAIVANEKERISQSLSIQMAPNPLDTSENQQSSKLYYSFDDMDIIGMVTKHPAKRENEKESDNLCYICVEKTPNAIVMNCGHGGMCYECAIESWRKGNKCVMCRREVDKILKVNFFENINISKPIHGIKKIIETRLIQSN